MKIDEYLSDLRNNRNIVITFDKAELKIKASKEALTKEIVEDIKSKKAEIIDFFKSLNGEALTVAIPQAQKKEYYKLSSAQKRLYFIQELDKTSIIYNLPIVIKAEGKLDKIKFKEVINQLIQRHESLRTSFHVIEGEVYQKIHDRIDLEIEFFQPGLNGIAQVIKDFARPFDLDSPILIRVGIIEVSAQEYILMTDVHHIISDGVSRSLLLKEVMSLYNNETLPELKLHYKDYAEWQQSEAQKAIAAKQKGFWLNEFSNTVNLPDLPTDFHRPLIKNYEGNYLAFEIDVEETATLKALAEREEATMFMVILSVYNILLSKLSNQEDIIIGTPVAGRQNEDLENIIGMFVNTLPLRNYPLGNLSFKDFLDRVKAKTVSCFENQDYPFEELINDLKIERDASRNALFEAVLAYQNHEQPEISLPGLKLTPYKNEFFVSKFDILLSVSEHDQKISLNFEYSTELFKKETIERFANYFKRIISSIIADVNSKISGIEIISEEEKLQLLESFNNTAVNYAKDKTIIDLFHEQVKHKPDNVAIVCNNKSITYLELDKRSTQLASLLRVNGVRNDVIVGLLMDRSMETVIGMLAILKAGGAYLPIDIDYPDERIAYLIKNSGTTHLLTSRTFQVDIPDNVLTLFIEDSKDRPVHEIAYINKPSDLCYIIYTSGTTGNPKGVMIEHKNVVRLLFNDKFQFDFGPNEVWTMFHSHCFDFSVWEIYGALLYGAKLVIVPKSDAMDPAKFLKILQDNKVTILNQTPTAFYNLIHEAQKDNIILSHLRYVIFGGEALSPIKLRSWYANHRGVKLINMFGITETTVHVTYKEISDNEIEHNICNIGKPIPTLSVYLFNKDMHLVPQGVKGELFVGGDGLARGYLHNAALTNERFVINPYKSGERLYKTGDLARISNGEIEYIGRNDTQVQLRGFRIELGEIEYHLTQHALIDNAVVIAKTDAGEQKYLCAYLVGKDMLPIEDIRAFLSDRVPSYMVPSYFMQIDSIPLTSNDKLDVNKLPEPASGSLSDYVEPRNEIEKKLAKVWSDVLLVDKVGAKDIFFNLGGDSLKAIGLIYEINKKLQSNLTIADLYFHPSVEGLSDLVNTKRTGERDAYLKAAAEVKAFQDNYKEQNNFPDSYEEVYPMGGVEKGMVFYALRKGDGEKNIHKIIYHEQNVYYVPMKDFSLAIFKRALYLMIDKHEELRKIYDLEHFAHIIKKEIEPEVHYLDISGLPGKEQENYISDKLYEERIRATDSFGSLLWRMSIIKVREDFHYLVFDMHHSVMDGWSLSSFLTELNNIYYHLTKDDNYVPEKLQCTYRDHIIGEIVAANNVSSAGYWQKELGGYTRLAFSKKSDEHRSIMRHFQLGATLRKDLEALADKLHTSLKHLCFAAYLYTMRMISNTDDIVVGITTNNRPVVPDGEKLIGCFLNVVPFRAEIPGEATWQDFVGYIDRKLRKQKEHDTVPLYKILDAIGEATQDGNPFFDTAFNYIDFRVFGDMLTHEGSEAIDNPGLDVDTGYVNQNTLHDFHVHATLREFRLTMKYFTSIIDDALAERMVRYFKNILHKFVSDINGAVSTESILSAEERNELLYTFNDTETPYPKEETIISLFEQQVLQTPHNTAIIYGEETISYQELKTKSDQVATYLSEKAGVVAGDLVGVMLERESYLLPAIYGILKAGAAYVPIDPHYPAERTTTIIQDSGLRALITRGKYLHANLQAKTTIIDLDTALENIRSHEIKQPATKITGSKLAYVIYTSGSTGKPKGVMIEHHSVINRLQWMQKAYPLTTSDVLLQKTPIAFDVSVWELFWWSFTGASLCLLQPGAEKDPGAILKTISHHKISTLHFVPSMLTPFLSASAELNHEIDISSLRQVFASGEALKPEQVNTFGAVLHKQHGTRLINLYGPTEATVDVTHYECSFEKETKQVPIGQPIDNTRLYIVDKNNELVPIGVPGELCIGGAGVARGYINNEPLTQEKFIELKSARGKRVYKTGDLASWLPDGNIEYLGRLDHQVKIRGYRIELGEIENVLLEYESVKEATVIVYDKSIDDRRLIAFVVSADRTISTLKIKKFLKTKLPDYMIPANFLKIDNIPLTNNGKIDRKALLLKLSDTPREVEKYVEPKTNTEMQLVSIWKELLGLERVSTNNTFIDLGGNSILLIRNTQLIKKQFDIELPFDFYFNHTLEQVSNRIDKLTELHRV